MKNIHEKVVVIVLNYNQNDYTIKCINSLLESNYNNYTVLLIDNGSSAENYLSLEKEIIKDSRILLLRIVENCGYVKGINYGFEKGIKLNPKYFLIMNNDTIIDKNSIFELVQTMNEYNNNALVSGKVYHYDNPEKIQFIGLRSTNERLLQYELIGVDEIDQGQYEETIEMDNLDDVFWLLPAKLYIEIGGYSTYFWFNYEQEDFAIRAKNIGYKLIYTPKAQIWHKGSISIGGRDYNPKQAYWTVQSSLILKYIHLNKINFINFYLITVISIIRTYFKSFYYKLFRKENIFTYAKAKFLGWTYFNKWVFNKKENTGINPL